MCVQNLIIKQSDRTQHRSPSLPLLSFALEEDFGSSLGPRPFPPHTPDQKILFCRSAVNALTDKQVIAIMGGQWGDEGKGKLVDILGEQYDVIARCAGGSNAGQRMQPPPLVHRMCRI